MNTVINVVGLTMVYLAGVFWCYSLIEFNPTGRTWLLLFLINLIMLSIGNYLIIYSVDGDWS